MILKPTQGLIAAGGFRNHPRYRGCVSHWLMAEGGGLVAFDASGYKKDGTLTGGPTWVGGLFGPAIKFDGTDDGIIVTGISVGTTHSHSFWINRINTNYVFDSQTGRFIISMGANGTANNFTFHDGTWRSLGTVSASVWHHCVLTLNAAASTAIAYLDGKQLGTSAYTPVSLGAAARIGSHYSGGTNYSGTLDDYRIYNRVLSAEDVASLYLDPFLEFQALRALVIGVSAAAAYTLTADVGTFALTGNAAALKADRKLSAALGTFALTGNAAGLKRGYPLAAGVGTFALTGNAAGLKADRRLTAAQGSFTLTGNATGLRADRQMPAALGVFTLTGNAAGVRRGYPLAAATGVFALTGNAAGLRAARNLPAATAAFVLTGQDATLVYAASTVLGAATGVFSFTGNPVGLTVTRNLVVAQGTFALTGNAAGLAAARALPAAQGIFNLTGNPAILGYTQYGGGSGGGTGSGSGSILSEMGIY